MIGRGSRSSEGKGDFTVYDYGDNAGRFGLWNIDRDWEVLWRGKPRKNLGVAPVKQCKKCGYLMAPSVSICPNCGEVIMTEKPLYSDKATTLINLTADYEKLRGRQISSLTPTELAIYCRQTQRKAYCKRIAVSKGLAYLTQYAKEINWKSGWHRFIKAEPGIPFCDILIR
jgi:hypothetical protein